MNAEVFISVFALTVSLIGVYLVYAQLSYFTKQLRLQSRIDIASINREILSLGFSDPRLFEILKGNRDIDQELEKRFLQMWINQIDVIWHANKYGLFEKDEWSAYLRDISDSVALESLTEHWTRTRSYYQPAFRTFLDQLLSARSEAAEKGKLPPNHSSPRATL